MQIFLGLFKGIGFSYKLVWVNNKSYLFFMAFIKVITGLIPVTLIYLTQKLINEVVGLFSKESSYSRVIFLFSLQIGIILFSYFLQYLSIINEKKVTIVIGKIINISIFEKINQISFINFEKPATYNKIQRLSSNQSSVLNVVEESSSFIRDLITVSSILFFLIAQHWAFILILFVGILPLFFIEMSYGNKRFELAKFLTPFGRLESYIAGLLNNRDSLKEIKLFGTGKYLISKWEENYQLFAKNELSLLKKQGIFTFIAQFLLITTYALSGLLVLLLISSGKLLVGSFVSVLQAVQNIQESLSNISRNIAKIYESSLFIEEYREFMEIEEVNEGHHGSVINQIEAIQIRDLAFTYPDELKPAIQNISIDIPLGKKIAIIGENGSGKTTLTKCISGLYEVSTGMISINGMDMNQINKNSFHKKISVLFQDYEKYNFTVKENIGFGNINNIENAEEIQLAAIRTGIHSKVEKFPKQYETILGRLFDGGLELSGGQWQKLALSRSLFRETDLIILDEPTSSLDPISEIEILQQLFKQTPDKSMIFITHRLGTAYLADEILVMKNGEIIERGSHSDLLSYRGQYYEMYTSQSQLYEKEGLVL
ncbi:ABC transporter ATP-binding protein/permease [Heyndrickxia oleronia]|uniref:ABC transporter ATP-binding protein n=1 Tax=Heyndrickxia oleronia TaxID=38875 RepID=UPI00203BF6B7|nr:ABC transporter ATP-binding protein [Heyndrickxia oleronia]MCM3239457.1 ABC transporter ATP-binding protein/permease [Heyndrickxia oleronia]